MLGDIFLVSYYAGSIGGGVFGNLLYQWEQAGVFAYVLPFLLIFALVFGLLMQLKIFEQKAVNVIIALAASLMALQFNFVSIFFSEIFPRMGVGISIILILVILAGFLFRGQAFQSWRGPIVFLIVVIFVIILYTSLESSGFLFGLGNWNFRYMDWSTIIMAILIIGGLIAIIASGNRRPPAGGAAPGP